MQALIPSKSATTKASSAMVTSMITSMMTSMMTPMMTSHISSVMTVVTVMIMVAMVSTHHSTTHTRTGHEAAAVMSTMMSWRTIDRMHGWSTVILLLVMAGWGRETRTHFECLGMRKAKKIRLF